MDTQDISESKLIELLHTFQARELRRFGEWLSSPIHCKDKDALSLYLVLREFFGRRQELTLDATKIWIAAFPGEGFDIKKFGYLMSELNGQAEAFLGAERSADQFLVGTSYSLDVLSERNLEKHYNLLLSKTEKDARRFSFRNAEYFYGKYLLASVGLRWFGLKKERALDAHLAEATEALDNFYLLSKLHLSCEHVNRNNILSIPYDSAPMYALREFVEKGNYDRVPAISAYYRMLLLLMDGSDESYRILRNFLERERQIFNPAERSTLYAWLRNYCISRIKKSEQNYQRELFELYRSNLSEGLLHEGGLLSPWTFKNVVSLFLLIGEDEWAAMFIEERSADLAPKFRETALAYNWGNYFYHTGQYDKALKTLNKVTFTDVFYSLDTRRILLKIFFEQGESEAFYSLVSSFRVYLRRNKLISESNREAYKNFVNLTAKLFRIESGDEKKLNELADELKSTQTATDEDWIEEKMKQRMA